MKLRKKNFYDCVISKFHENIQSSRNLFLNKAKKERGIAFTRSDSSCGAQKKKIHPAFDHVQFVLRSQFVRIAGIVVYHWDRFFKHPWLSVLIRSPRANSKRAIRASPATFLLKVSIARRSWWRFRCSGKDSRSRLKFMEFHSNHSYRSDAS